MPPPLRPLMEDADTFFTQFGFSVVFLLWHSLSCSFCVAKFFFTTNPSCARALVAR